MSDMSDYLEQNLLNLCFRTLASFKPAAVYVALYTTATTDAGGGTEVTGGSYARVQVTQLDANWNAPGVGGLIDNVSAITFPTATASWGTITHVGIRDASTAGNLLVHGALTASKTVGSGDTVEFAAGDLDITFA